MVRLNCVYNGIKVNVGFGIDICNKPGDRRWFAWDWSVYNCLELFSCYDISGCKVLGESENVFI